MSSPSLVYCGSLGGACSASRPALINTRAIRSLAFISFPLRELQIPSPTPADQESGDPFLAVALEADQSPRTGEGIDEGGIERRRRSPLWVQGEMAAIDGQDPGGVKLGAGVGPGV